MEDRGVVMVYNFRYMHDLLLLFFGEFAVSASLFVEFV